MKRHPHAIAIFVLFALLFVARIGQADEATVEEQFLKANQAYQAQHFAEAAQGYEALLQVSDQQGHVLFNLGNAYFRLNDLGRAILNYERARMLIPRDPDLDYNLRYAREQLKDMITPQQAFIKMVFFWLDGFSLLEVVWIFAAFNAFFWGALLLRLFTKTEWSFYLFAASLGLWLIAGTSLGLKWNEIKNDDRSVVIAQEVNVLAGPDPGNTLLFKLHAGTIIYSERFEDGWTLINLADKKRGWVRSNAIEPIKRAHSPLLAVG